MKLENSLTKIIFIGVIAIIMIIFGTLIYLLARPAVQTESLETPESYHLVIYQQTDFDI